METIIKLKPAEFNIDFMKYLKKYVDSSDATEIVIELKRNGKTSVLEKETRTQMKRRIERAIENTESGKNLIAFTGEEFELLAKKLSNK
ncbi:MAG TPA: hypothetical protein VE978_15305 [Chitinophagales bacterium]|nr:hypothetical protein [Chitinophagales bacterium]